MLQMRPLSMNTKTAIVLGGRLLWTRPVQGNTSRRREWGRDRATVVARARRPVAASLTASSRVSVSERMLELKTAQKTAFIPFLCAGDPDLKTTAEALRYLSEISADVIELGVPYSDPLADGPVIHGAATRALEQGPCSQLSLRTAGGDVAGTSLNDVLDMLTSVTPDLKSPLVLFTYFNPIRARGLDVFCRQIKEAGVSGLLVPDLPLELTHEIREACGKQGIELVLLATPTSPKERMREIAEYSQGFIYLVSVTGVTGTRESLNQELQRLIHMLHDTTDKSIGVGFGVSTGEQAKQLQEWGADGVIVGSALVKALHEGGISEMKVVAKSIKDAIA